MSRLSREQWIGSGAFALFLTLTGLAGGDKQPSVAHAALNMLNNRPEGFLMQTIPPLPTDTPTPIFTPEITPTKTPLPPPTDTPTPIPTFEPTPEIKPACVADILALDEDGNFGATPLQIHEPDGDVLQIGGIQSYGLEKGSTSYEIGTQLPFTLTDQLDPVDEYSVVVFDNTAECQVNHVEVAANNPIGGHGEITIDATAPQFSRSAQAGTATRLESGAQINPDGTVNIHVTDAPAGVTIDAQMESGSVGYSPSTPDSFEIQGESSAAVVHFSDSNQNDDAIIATIELGAITPNEKRDIVVNENDQGQTEVIISTDTDSDGIPDTEQQIVDENGDGILEQDEEVPQAVEHDLHLPLIQR